MGVHRKSIQEKIANGTWRPHIHGPLEGFEMQPIIEENDPTPPSCLSKWAKDVWKELFPKLTKSGILTGGEREIFMAYCDAVGMYTRAIEQINTGGVIKKRKVKRRGEESSVLASFDSDGESHVECSLRVWYKIRKDAMNDIARFASLLGLTTIHRSRVLLAKKKGDKSPKSVPITRPQTALDRLASGS